MFSASSTTMRLRTIRTRSWPDAIIAWNRWSMLRKVARRASACCWRRRSSASRCCDCSRFVVNDETSSPSAWSREARARF
jgi:hypothetical protein